MKANILKELAASVYRADCWAKHRQIDTDRGMEEQEPQLWADQE